MRINLSRLIGNASDNERLSRIDGMLPSERLVFANPFAGAASIEPTGSPAFDIDGHWIQRIEFQGRKQLRAA